MTATFTHPAKIGDPATTFGAGQLTVLRRELVDRLTAAAQRAEAAGSPLVGPTRAQRLEALIEQIIDEQSTRQVEHGGGPLDGPTRSGLAAALRATISGMGPFEQLLADPDVENINCNGCDQVWVRYADGRNQQMPPVAASDTELIDWVRRVVAGPDGSQERRFDRGHPVVSGQLPDGSRLHAVMDLGQHGVYVSMRKFRLAQTSLDALRRTGTVDARTAAVLAAAVRARLNLLIAGGTVLGKTTLLRALAGEIDPTERVITVEDAFELGLGRTLPDVVALQAREPNIEGVGEVDAAELVRCALRMSPERVIVGEVRGGEVVPMLLAMAQGCDGSMGTIHASTSQQALLKLGMYAAQADERLPLDASALLISSAVDLVVHLDYTPGTHTRVVSSIREVAGADGTTVSSNEIFRPDPASRRAVPAPGAMSQRLGDRLIAAGLDERVVHDADGW
ncbi:CpaF family protein [Actinocatenispora comari]|uniref:Protein kinase n=1 Tax=Actinocatenispora comari TaxID=2807577 RepID=A0A8J4EM13_9ACTN|nr:ATPase, T2SS/T4P/T4SS family [Actinocatenispora comari]GIL29076.1 protein kinase [Actinocatenispora comari]